MSDLLENSSDPMICDDFGNFVMPLMSRRVPTTVDLVFAVDRSGKWFSFAEGIRRAIPMIVQRVSSRVPRVRLFLQTHGDLDYGQRPIMMVRDGTPDDLYREVDRIDFGGGGDLPEHHSHALETVIHTVDWTKPKRDWDEMGPHRRVVVLFSTGVTKPSPSGRSTAQIAEALLAAGIMLFAVCEMEPGMNALVDGAQGHAFPLGPYPTVEEVQGIAAQLAISLTSLLSSS